MNTRTTYICIYIHYTDLGPPRAVLQVRLLNFIHSTYIALNLGWCRRAAVSVRMPPEILSKGMAAAAPRVWHTNARKRPFHPRCVSRARGRALHTSSTRTHRASHSSDFLINLTFARCTRSAGACACANMMRACRATGVDDNHGHGDEQVFPWCVRARANMLGDADAASGGLRRTLIDFGSETD